MLYSEYLIGDWPVSKKEAAMFGKELNVKREGFELVYRASGSMEAEVIKGRLEASGIPALLDSESHMLPFSVSNMGEVRILVPSERAEEARELLGAEGNDEESEEPDSGDAAT
jgi:Putative prokaryotic signal transducing protein